VVGIITPACSPRSRARLRGSALAVDILCTVVLLSLEMDQDGAKRLFLSCGSRGCLRLQPKLERSSKPQLTAPFPVRVGSAVHQVQLLTCLLHGWRIEMMRKPLPD
jgi:hypothetical protein